MIDTTTRRRPSVRRAGLLATAVAVIALAGCGGGGDDGDEPAAGAPPAESSTTAAPTTEATTTTEAPTTEAPTTEAPTTEAPTTESEGDLVDYAFTDDFADDSGWLVGCSDIGCAAVVDGTFTSQVNAGEIEIDQHSDWEGQVFANIQVGVNLASFGTGGGAGGVVCYYDAAADSFYEISVNGQGDAFVYRKQDGDYQQVDGPLPVPAFTSGPEYLDLSCTTEADGTVSVTVSVNNQEIGRYTDPNALLPGEVGLITTAFPSAGNTITYDDVEVSGLVFVR